MTNYLPYIFITLFALKTVTELYLNWRNLRHIKNHQGSVPEGFQEKISLEEHNKAARYSCEKIKLSQLSILFHSLIFLAWLPGGGLNQIDQIARTWATNQWQQGLTFFAIFFIISYFLSLPEKIYHTFVIEQKYGFNKTTPKIFITDQIKQLLLMTIISVALLSLVLKIMSSYPEHWWFIAWVVIIAFQFFMMWAFPVVIAPLFNKFSPLEEGEVKKQVQELLDKTGFESDGIFIMDASKRSAHGNAYFTGLGKKKRIVFFDNLIKSLDSKEIKAVLAHELGHFKKKHILKSLIRSVFISLLGFYILGKVANNDLFYQSHFVSTNSTYMALMLFSLVVPVYTFFLEPISTWLSRKNEYEADTFAAEFADARDLISSLIKLYKENASTLTPDPIYSKFYHSHPPAIERISHLKSLVT